MIAGEQPGTAGGPADSSRDRILRAATDLVAVSGGEPVSTRAVCTAAGIGAPTLYHYFGDKEGLFEAVAGYGLDRYLAGRPALRSTGDPLDGLRRAWDDLVGFARAEPALYLHAFGTVRPGYRPAAAARGYRLLLAGARTAAQAGRLRVPPEAAADLLFPASVGLGLEVIAEPDRPAGTHADRVRETLLAAVTAGSAGTPVGSLAAQAIALDASLDTAPGALSPAESALLREWLARLAGA